jgi:hypothetical protein
VLAPGGRVVVTEYLGGRDPAAQSHAAMLGVTMMAGTTGGRLCRPEMVASWFAGAGLVLDAVPEPVANTDVLVAALAGGGN